MKLNLILLSLYDNAGNSFIVLRKRSFAFSPLIITSLITTGSTKLSYRISFGENSDTPLIPPKYMVPLASTNDECSENS